MQPTVGCPYRQHALIMQEHEAWDVLLACQGQIRVGPSRHIIGIDMNAALRIASARGYDLAVLSDLLPAAEAGMVDLPRLTPSTFGMASFGRG